MFCLLCSEMTLGVLLFTHSVAHSGFELITPHLSLPELALQAHTTIPSFTLKW